MTKISMSLTLSVVLASTYSGAGHTAKIPSGILAPFDITLASQAGKWQGELYYLDYLSDERYSIPMRINAELSPDGVTLIRHITFTDPSNEVHAVNVMTFDEEANELVESYFRQHSGELFRYQIDNYKFVDPHQWHINFSHQGVDDERPAKIIHRIEMSGKKLSSEKHVCYQSQPNNCFLRNGSKLTLIE